MKQNQMQLQNEFEDAMLELAEEMGYQRPSVGDEGVLRRRLRRLRSEKRGLLCHLDQHWDEELVIALDDLNRSFASARARLSEIEVLKRSLN